MHLSGLILLAAGGSSRMGRPKQLLPWKGRTLLRHAGETAVATRCQPVIAVLGSNAEACAAELRGLHLLTVVNVAWSRGLGASIATGITTLQEQFPEVASALLTLVDQPGISPEFLTLLLAQAEKNPDRIIATRYPHGGGVPAVFPRDYFQQLRLLDADQGARALMTPLNSILIDAPARSLLDLDTPENYEESIL